MSSLAIAGTHIQQSDIPAGVLGGTYATPTFANPLSATNVTATSMTVKGTNGMTVSGGSFDSIFFAPGTGISNPQIYASGTQMGFGGAQFGPAFIAGAIGSAGTGINAGSGGLQAGTVNVTIGVPFDVRTASTFESSMTVTDAAGIWTPKITINAGGLAGQALCWKTNTTLSYCDSVVGASGGCTCH